MVSERRYSTCEVAQMWNVSESTVKRWTDLGLLRCVRSPGGHRRFRLEDLIEFQHQRAFEATGLLSTNEWEEPNLENWLNCRNFQKVRELLLYLAAQNQRSKVSGLLDRLYLRGMALEEIYEEVLAPVPALTGAAGAIDGFSEGQSLLARNLIEEALNHLGPRLIRRRPNGRQVLCAAPVSGCRLPLTFLTRLLEVEGWETLYLGDEVPLGTMSQMVETEPVGMVCLYCDGRAGAVTGGKALGQAARRYRIPVLLQVPRGEKSNIQGLDPEERFDDLRDFQRYVRKVGAALRD